MNNKRILLPKPWYLEAWFFHSLTQKVYGLVFESNKTRYNNQMAHFDKKETTTKLQMSWTFLNNSKANSSLFSLARFATKLNLKIPHVVCKCKKHTTTGSVNWSDQQLKLIGLWRSPMREMSTAHTKLCPSSAHTTNHFTIFYYDSYAKRKSTVTMHHQSNV